MLHGLGHRQRFSTSRRAILCGFAGLVGTSVVPAHGEGRFSFGVSPVFLDSDISVLPLLQEYLARQLDQPVLICDFSYVQHEDRLALLAVPVYRHQPWHESYVIVNEASEAGTFDDIRGTVHAFSDPDSTSGYLFTRWLLALRRESPAEFFRDSFFTYGYRNVIRAVAARLAESGSIEGYVWDVMKERNPALVDKTRIVFRSEWLGFPPVVALQTSRDRPATQALTAALFDMTSHRLGREILSILELDGFTTARSDLYESTAEMWRVVRAQM